MILLAADFGSNMNLFASLNSHRQCNECAYCFASGTSCLCFTGKLHWLPETVYNQAPCLNICNKCNKMLEMNKKEKWQLKKLKDKATQQQIRPNYIDTLQDWPDFLTSNPHQLQKDTLTVMEWFSDSVVFKYVFLLSVYFIFVANKAAFLSLTTTVNLHVTE